MDGRDRTLSRWVSGVGVGMGRGRRLLDSWRDSEIRSRYYAQGKFRRHSSMSEMSIHTLQVGMRHSSRGNNGALFCNSCQQGATVVRTRTRSSCRLGFSSTRDETNAHWFYVLSRRGPNFVRLVTKPRTIIEGLMGPVVVSKTAMLF